MILSNKKENIVYQENTSNNKLLDFWYKYNKLIIIVAIILIFGLIVLILINSSHNNQEPEVDDSAYIGIETIMVMNAKKYVTNNKLEINEIGKYLSLNYLNLIVKEDYNCNSNSGVQISKVNNEIKYVPYLVCDEYQSNAIKEIILENEKIEELKIIGSNPYFITKSYNELGYNIDDKYTVNITGVNDIEPGVNLIKYNVLKNNSYYKTANRIVIAENIRGSYPELVLEGKETMTIPKGSTYVEPGYKAVDKIDGTITDKVIVNNNIDTNKAGTYSINYSITNNKKLTTTINRTIIVNDSDLKLDITNSVQTIDKKANIVLTIAGKGYLKTVLPNKEMSTLPNVTYTVYKNGTYTFTIYDTNNNSETYDVKISTLDQTPPQGACTGTISDDKTIVNVTANEAISKYEYYFDSESYISKNSTYSIKKMVGKVNVTLYDTSNNKANISCKLDDQTSELTAGFTEQKYDGMKYWLYIPKGMKAKSLNKNPLVVFLHGSGECGTSLGKLLHGGLPQVINAGHEFKGIIISPQSSWAWTNARLSQVKAIIDNAISKYNIDTDRISMTGHSLGSMGTWNFACQYKGFLSAIAPLSYGAKGNYNYAKTLKTMPIKAYCGSKDRFLKGMISTTDSINRAGGHAEMIILDDMGHGITYHVYTKTDIIDWLISQNRANNS